ncbi:MAG: hypothetical protein IJ262_10080 [Clostridia bacterium]|nr:hypothetical protein [Clostridia bacterium]
MKKALSVFLAVLMMFSCLAVGASASSSANPSPWHGDAGSGKPATYEQCVVTFDAAGGTFKQALYVYDLATGAWDVAEAGSLKGVWAMVPQDSASQKPTQTIKTPTVTAPEGWQFDGWYCAGYMSLKATELQGVTVGANTNLTLPTGCAGEVLQFTAAYSPAEPEEDTMATVMGILIKIFGTIIGILMYRGDADAGIAMMEKVLGGVLG